MSKTKPECERTTSHMHYHGNCNHFREGYPRPAQAPRRRQVNGAIGSFL